MRAVITKDVVGELGTVFTVGQVVEGQLMKYLPGERWADEDEFIVKVGMLEYAIDLDHFKRPFWMRIGDFIKEFRKQA